MELSTAQFLAAFLAAVYLYMPDSVDPGKRPRDTPQEEVQHVYDYIIVGAGSAGCVVANRLTEIPNVKVLLIEAGGDEDPLTDLPLLFTLSEQTKHDWNYTTVKQEKACLSKNGLCSYPRGRVLGGCSTINAMLYVRGHKEDYNEWARMGNEGWSYKDILPYFIKAENNTEPTFANSPYHGMEGPLNVQYPRYSTPMREMYMKAGEEFGWQRGDYNGERQDVVGYMQTTTDGPFRESTARAYLKPIQGRKNLSIIKNSVVTKIIIDNKVAAGVEYFRDGKMYSVFAEKEVIISAGAINSPKLLMLSGIGPKDELDKHNISVISDLPVGKFLQDHMRLEMIFEINDNIMITPRIWKSGASIQQYTQEFSGPLTTPGGEAMAFINTVNRTFQPNLQFMYFSTTPFGTNDTNNTNLIDIILSNVKPKSMGSVKLKSHKWEDDPLIDTAYFSHPDDFEVFRKGVQLTFDYMNTPTMKALSPKFFMAQTPACEGVPKDTFVDCLISQYGNTIFHPVGTARMGPEGQEAVVNSNLQVYGIKYLRVIDSSVMPTIPGGNTNAPTIMIAEKGADMVKAYLANNWA